MEESYNVPRPGRPKGSKTTVVTLKSLVHLRVQLSWVWNELRAGRMKNDRARTFASLGNTLAAVMSQAGLEEELKAVKERVEQIEQGEPVTINQRADTGKPAVVADTGNDDGAGHTPGLHN